MTRSVLTTNAKSRPKLMQSRKHHGRHRALPSTAHQPTESIVSTTRSPKTRSRRVSHVLLYPQTFQRNCATNMQPYSGAHLRQQYLMLLGYILAWHVDSGTWATARKTRQFVQICLHSQLKLVPTTIQKMFRTAAMQIPRWKSPCAHTATRETIQWTNVGQKIQARSSRSRRNAVPRKHPCQDHLPVPLFMAATST